MLIKKKLLYLVLIIQIMYIRHNSQTQTNAYAQIFEMFVIPIYRL